MSNQKIYKMLKRIFLLLLLAFVISQFLRPVKNESSYDTITAFEQKTMVEGDVKTILENNCYDCHSNYTRYPWYMEVSPVSHWMAHHIKEGKEHFNVSEWDSYTDKQKDRKLEELVEEVEGKKMPLKVYTWMHGELSAQDTKKIVDWANDIRSKGNQVEDTLNTKKTDSLVQPESAETAVGTAE